MEITSRTSTEVYDRHFSLRCPHCGDASNVTVMSLPDYTHAMRFQLAKIGLGYFCNSCKEPIFLKFSASYEPGSQRLQIHEGTVTEVERPKETFDYQYLPATVSDDFREALICYSNLCYQAFAAMCRRTAQSAFDALGAPGKDKVLNQLNDLRDTVPLDDETYELLKQIVISGHDGAHPHLPRLSAERAATLLELMKDVLYQLFVRQAKIQKAMELRQKDIADSKEAKPK